MGCRCVWGVARQHWGWTLGHWARANWKGFAYMPDLGFILWLSGGRASFQEATWVEKGLDLEKNWRQGSRERV